MGWQNKPTDFTAIVTADTTDHQKAIVMSALQGVVLQSPVDTGSWRMNHNVGVGRIDESTNNSTDAMNRGKGSLASLAPFTSVYISNSQPQSAKIEFGGFTSKPETPKTIDGYSKQAPHGVYGLTFQLVSEKYK